MNFFCSKFFFLFYLSNISDGYSIHGLLTIYLFYYFIYLFTLVLKYFVTILWISLLKVPKFKLYIELNETLKIG